MHYVHHKRTVTCVLWSTVGKPGTTTELPNPSYTLRSTHTLANSRLTLFYLHSQVDDDEFSKFLMEGTICEVLSWNGRVIGVDLPINVELEVKMTDPGIKGNTVSGGDKPAEVMTGAMVTVPLFIQIGEKIVVDTTSGKYVKRAKE